MPAPAIWRGLTVRYRGCCPPHRAFVLWPTLSTPFKTSRPLPSHPWPRRARRQPDRQRRRGRPHLPLLPPHRAAPRGVQLRRAGGRRSGLGLDSALPLAQSTHSRAIGAPPHTKPQRAAKPRGCHHRPLCGADHPHHQGAQQHRPGRRRGHRGGLPGAADADHWAVQPPGSCQVECRLQPVRHWCLK